MMDSMKFVKLDLMTIKSYMKMILYTCFILCVALLPSNPLLLNILLFVIGLTIISYPFVSAEQYKLDKFYAMLPINREDIIRARYLSVVLLALLVVVILIPFNFLLRYVLRVEASVTDVISLIALGLVSFCVIVSIQIPLYFKYGYAKAKVLTQAIPLVTFLVIPVLIGIAANFVDDRNILAVINDIAQVLFSNYLSIAIGCAVVSMLALVGSYCISLKIYLPK